MSAVDGEQAPVLSPARPLQRPRYLRMILLAIFAQYTIVSLVVGLSVAATLRYFVTPQIVAKFEALSEALKHQAH
jgi:PHP family Zn ribbon phosphoesterase